MTSEEELEIDEDDELSLLETLDHVLERGLVIAGEVTIAVADIDLVYLGLNLFLGSVETVNRVLGERDQRVQLLSAAAARAVSAPRAGADDGGRAHETADETKPGAAE